LSRRFTRSSISRATRATRTRATSTASRTSSRFCGTTASASSLRRACAG
jgi:hypothetical protein